MYKSKENSLIGLTVEQSVCSKDSRSMSTRDNVNKII